MTNSLPGMEMNGKPDSVAMAFASGLIGLLISYNFSLPSGPSIILTAGGFYVGSILLGTRDSLRTRYFPRAHFHE